MKPINFIKIVALLSTLAYTGTSIHAGLWSWFTTPHVNIGLYKSYHAEGTPQKPIITSYGFLSRTETTTKDESSNFFVTSTNYQTSPLFLGTVTLAVVGGLGYLAYKNRQG